MLAARDSALSDSISDSFAWMSLKVVSSPSRCMSNLVASVDVSAIEARSASSVDSSLLIFWILISISHNLIATSDVLLVPPEGACARHQRPALLVEQVYHLQ